MSFECKSCHDRAGVTCGVMSPYSSFGTCEACGERAPCSNCKCPTKAPESAGFTREGEALVAALDQRSEVRKHYCDSTDLKIGALDQQLRDWIVAVERKFGGAVPSPEPADLRLTGEEAFERANNCAVDIIGYPTMDGMKDFPVKPLEVRAHVEKAIAAAMRDTRERCAAFLEHEAAIWRRSATSHERSLPPNRGTALEDAATKLRRLTMVALSEYARKR